MDMGIIDILNMNDTELMQLSQQRVLSLNLAEMKAIQNYFKGENRNPTDLEIETIAQTWSEHCKHKVFNSEIIFIENNKKRFYKNLFKETIVKATREYIKKSKQKNICVSVFKDNAGIIKFNKSYHIAFKVETHNHPSALDPFGGANTGVGGVIRDILGTGLGALPVASIDVLCFGYPDYDYAKLPPGVLHPRRIYNGVVQGIKDYGNKIGIPTVNGSIHFDNRYVGNPLVYVGTAGIIPRDKCHKKVKPNDLIVVIGGKTGRDGIHGATFSSTELDSQSEQTSSAAVQIGDPITEKKFMDVLIRARDLNLYTNITDCGAGGFSSAVGEMADPIGAEVYLDRVPLKYKGLRPWEIFLSESQERMVLAVSPKNVRKLVQLFNDEDVEATVIGKFTDTGRLKVFYKNRLCGDISLDFLHNGVPKSTRKAVWFVPRIKESSINEQKDYTKDLLKLLSSYEIASKESVIREYDFEVKAATILKPLQGKNQGPGDATVIMPDLKDTKTAMVIAHGINIRYGDIDPYWMAASAIDEALRNAVCAGADIDDCALLDNFCWGNPENEKHLAALVKSAQACCDAAIGLKIPFISGKDSFYNEFVYTDLKGKKRIISIPYTLLISVVGKIEVSNVISMEFKKPGNSVYIVGLTRDEMGGSCYLELKNKKSTKVPIMDFKIARKIFKRIAEAVKRKLIISAHDVSDGGLIVALAEMSLASGFGFNGTAENVPAYKIEYNYQLLFSESNTRFIVEVPQEKKDIFEKFFKNITIGFVGTILDSTEFIFKGINKDIVIRTSVQSLLSSWRNPRNWGRRFKI